VTPNRVVVALSPLFIALAGWVVEWVANNFPGAPQLDKTQLTILFGAGATFAAAHIAQWLHGWQKHETRKLAAAASVSAAATLTGPPPPEPAPLNVKPVPPAGEPS
jgi:hypothetical protein